MAEIPNLKILLIGNSSVGKSSLLLRFSNSTFLPPDESSATIGVDFKIKSITLKERVEQEAYEEPTQDGEPQARAEAGAGRAVSVAGKGQAVASGRRVKLSIWDTAGQERFRVITGSYYRGAQGVILVYDISSRSSFEEMLRWLREVDTYCPQDICKILVGNKVDRELSRQVSTAEGREFARRVGMGFIECSAMNNIGVNEVFERLAQMILDDPDSTSVGPTPHRGAVRLTQGDGNNEDDEEDNDEDGRGGCSC